MLSSVSSGIQSLGRGIYTAGAGACGIGASLFAKVGSATHGIFAGLAKVGGSGLQFTAAHPTALGAVVCIALGAVAFKAYQKYHLCQDSVVSDCSRAQVPKCQDKP